MTRSEVGMDISSWSRIPEEKLPKRPGKCPQFPVYPVSPQYWNSPAKFTALTVKGCQAEEPRLMHQAV